MKTFHLLVVLLFSFITLPAQAVITLTRAVMMPSGASVEISYTSSAGNSNANIGCGVRYCQFGIWIVDSVQAHPGRIVLDGGTNGGTDTWANANIVFFLNNRESGTFTGILPVSRVPPYSVCVGGAQNNLGYLYRNQPGTSCLAVSTPPAPTSCAFNGSPTIDHGSLRPDLVNGKQDSVSVTVNCNRATSATISSLGGTINLGGGVTSTLTFDGLTSGTISLPSGNSTHTIASTLRATNPTPGDKSGSGTIVINLP